MHRSSLALLVLGGLSCAAAFSDEPGDKPKRPARGEERGVAVLRRHIPCATCVAFSHDGRTLASGYEDRVVKLWVVTTRRETDTLTGYHSSVGALAFSPDDRMIAGSGGTGDSSIRVWDAKKGKSFQTLKGHTSKVTSVAWSPDGKILASCGEDDSLRIWDATKWKELACLKLKKEETIFCLAFSPDGKTLASGTRERRVVLWDAASWKVRRTLKGHTGNVTSVSFAGDGKTLASGSGPEKVVRIWDPKTGELKARVPVGDISRAVALSPDGTRLATGHYEGQVKLWEVTTGKCLRALEGHKQIVSGLAFSPDGKLLASASHDGTVRLWDLKALLEAKPK